MLHQKQSHSRKYQNQIWDEKTDFGDIKGIMKEINRFDTRSSTDFFESRPFLLSLSGEIANFALGKLKFVLRMNFTIPESATGNEQLVVTEANTADALGSGLVKVLSTPALVALMERTCFNSVAAFLPSDYTTVGISVNIRHCKASPVGRTVVCNSKLVDIDGKKLTFEVTAHDGETLVGSGQHERFVVETEKFMQKL